MRQEAAGAAAPSRAGRPRGGPGARGGRDSPRAVEVARPDGHITFTSVSPRGPYPDDARPGARPVPMSATVASALPAHRTRPSFAQRVVASPPWAWVAAAVVIAALSLLGPSNLTYDAWYWLIWGR